MTLVGVKSNRVDQKSLADELIVNRAGTTGRQSIGALATQLAQTSPIAALGAATKFVATYADLPAASTLDAGTPRTVVADDNGDNNGTWFVDDSSGSKVWTYGYPLPFSNIRATDTGAGTANAIRAYSNAPVSESVQIILRLYRSNLVGASTISFNDGEALTIRSIDGVTITQAGLLAAGRQISGFINDSFFDLTTDVSSAANLTGSQAAQAASENARDLALQYASDAATVSGVNVPIYAGRASAGAATIAAAINRIDVQFYSPNFAVPTTLVGGGRYRRVSYSDLSAYPAESYFRSIDRFMPDGTTNPTNGGYWVLDDIVASPEKFGALADGSNIDRNAVVAAKTYALLKGTSLRLSGNKTYNVGSTATDLSGVTIDPEPGARLTGNLILNDNWLVTRPMVLNIVPSTGYPWTMRLSPRHKQALTEKAIFLGTESADRSIVAPIDCTTLGHYTLSFPGSDSFTGTTIVYADPRSIAQAAQNSSAFRLSLTTILPREEITAYFDNYAPAGNYSRSACVRTSNGFVIFYANGSDTGNIAWKVNGAAVGGLSGIDWPGRTEQGAYKGSGAYITIRAYDWQTIGFFMSGKEVWRGKIGVEMPADLGFITAAGFGITNAADGVVIGEWSRRKNLTQGYGAKPVKILVIGDSLSENWHMAWPGQLREALSHLGGARVDIAANYAVGGQTSAQQLTILTANGVPAGTTHVIGTLSTNDQQGGVSVTDLRTRLSSIKSIIDAAGAKLIFILPPMSYTSTQAPSHGGDMSNYANNHIYRTALMRWCADNNVRLVDANAALPPQLPSYIGTEDEVIRDNIHWAPMSMRAIAVAAARTIAGDISPPFGRDLPRISFPTWWLVNGWSAGTGLSLSISGGVVRLHGSVTKSSPANQIVAFIPTSIAPPFETVRRGVASGGSAAVNFGITTTGALYVNGLSGADTQVWVDGLEWPLDSVLNAA